MPALLEPNGTTYLEALANKTPTVGLNRFAFPEFCGKWFEGCVINHKDENPANNAATNIEVCTQVYNCNYGAHNEKLSKSMTKNAVCQLTLNGQFVKKFDNACSAARSLGVHFQNIYKALHGEIPSAYGFKWQYA